jgi:hypothetical protein
VESTIWLNELLLSNEHINLLQRTSVSCELRLFKLTPQILFAESVLKEMQLVVVVEAKPFLKGVCVSCQEKK